jgi:Spy/CpxP family protein refolding chaperone
MTMRTATASVIIAALTLAPLALVQAQGTQSKSPAKSPAQEETQTPTDQSTVIRAIQVVDVKDLKPEVRSKIEDVAAKTSEDDLRSLRSSIDATPEVVSALKAKGLSSSQVVAINIVDGVLTLFAKTA